MAGNAGPGRSGTQAGWILHGHQQRPKVLQRPASAGAGGRRPVNFNNFSASAATTESSVLGRVESFVAVVDDAVSQRDTAFKELQELAKAQSRELNQDIAIAELPEQIGTLVGRRSRKAQERSPERLHLDRQRLESCPLLLGEESLRLLNFQNNGIAQIENLETLVNLVFLDLYDNKVAKIENLDSLVNLRVLMLGKNQVACIESLSNLTKLDVLDLHSNKIVQLSGLEQLQELRVLNLASNLLREVKGIGPLRSLTELNIRRNLITGTEGLEGCLSLHRLFASHNRLATVRGAAPLANNAKLTELSLDGNPLCEMQDYRPCVLAICKSLKHLDSKEVSEMERALVLAAAHKAALGEEREATALLQEGELRSTAPPVLDSRPSPPLSSRPHSARPSPLSPPRASLGSQLPKAAPEVKAQQETNQPLPANDAGKQDNDVMVSLMATAPSDLEATETMRRSSSTRAWRRVLTTRSTSNQVPPTSTVASSKAPAPTKKPLTGTEVLQEIRAEWAEITSKGSSKPPKYGYLRRETATELAVFGRGLEALDKPEYHQNVRSLCFHYIIIENISKDMELLLRFQSLSALRFSRNLIHRISQLLPLQKLHYVKSLSVDENPVCENRSALRLHLIHMLPNISILNGIEVTTSERQAAARLLEPFSRAALKYLSGAPFASPPESQVEEEAEITRGLLATACTGDRWVSALHEHFEDVLRELIGEARQDLLVFDRGVSPASGL